VGLSGRHTIATLDSLPGFREFASDNDIPRDADVEIRLDGRTKKSLLPGARLLHSTTSGGVVHSIWSTEGGCHLRMNDCGGGSLAEMRYRHSSREIEMSCCESVLYLKMALWFAFAFVAVGLDRIPVHASAIVKDGGAVLFLGESGTGKSTQSGLWMRHIEGSWLLNDDSPLVRVASGEIYACGSPWSGKTHCYCPRMVPLKAMVRLRQGARNTIERLGSLSSIGAIFPSCPPLLALDGSLAARMLATVGSIATRVPVYRMECRPDREAVEVAYKAIYKAG
jgi:hypothetical protein